MISRAAVERHTPALGAYAIHLATAISLGEDLGALCAYDIRLGSAAGAKRIDVLAPR